MKLRSKRGDVPVTILIIGVVAICALAIFSFISSSFKTAQSFTGVSLMEELNAKIDSYYFYLEKGLSQEEAEQIVGIENRELYLAEDTEFKLWGDDEFLFSVKYIFP